MVVLNRTIVPFKDESSSFHIKERVFRRQYFHVYTARLRELQTRVVERVRDELKTTVSVVNLSELDSEDGTDSETSDVVIVGTIFKDQKFKPNILALLNFVSSENPSDAINASTLQPLAESYISDCDQLILEDDSQRIKLDGEVDKNMLVTGVVCGFLGRQNKSGVFHVKQMFFPKPPLAKQMAVKLEKDVFIVLISGLELCERVDRSFLSMQLLADWICGLTDQVETSSQISRVIIAGNSLNSMTRDVDDAKKARYLTKDADAKSVDGVKSLDEFLHQLLSFVPVDIMPGKFDPATQLWPQQPLNRCLFTESSSFKESLRTVSNPYMTTANNSTLICGTSGQNVDDIKLNSKISDPLDVMERLLHWSHLAPTSPDTLALYPYASQQTDPLILRDNTPDVMFVGNQSSFATRTVKFNSKDVTLISVPKFSVTNSVVLVNLKNMDCLECEFNVNL